MVVVVEGKSDKTFIESLLTSLNITFSDDNFIVMGNKSNLLNNKEKKYKTLKNSIESGKISSNILFILDADYLSSNMGYEHTQKAIENTREELGFKKFAKYFISCHPQSKEGYLESLILSTIDDEQNKCIKNVLECAEIEKKNDKDIFNKVYRYYYPNSAINLEHNNFKTLRNELKDLFKK